MKSGSVDEYEYSLLSASAALRRQPARTDLSVSSALEGFEPAWTLRSGSKLALLLRIWTGIDPHTVQVV